MSDQQIEQEIQAKGLTAPRVTPVDIEAEIVHEYYGSGIDFHDPADGREEDRATLKCLTFCVLVLRNGHKVVGINHGAVDASNFDAAYGREDARDDAIRQVWPLLGFRLRDHLAGTGLGYSATDMASQGAEGFRDGHAAALRGDAPLDH